MLKTSRETGAHPLGNQRGIGLITAIFVIVVVGMFGTLIARYAVIGSVSSAEDYHWAQALYSAQSAAQVAILYNDGGGSGSRSLTTVAGFTVSVANIFGGVRAGADKTVGGTAIHRDVEIRTSL